MEVSSTTQDGSSVHLGRLADLPRRQRRRLFVRAFIDAVATGTLLTVAYFVLPLDRLSGMGDELLLTIGLLAVVVIIIWEVRAILRSDFPGIQAVQALAIAVPLFLLLFSTAYYLMSRTTPATFTQHLTRMDALYFTVTTFATVGFGDITAKSEAARIIVTIQMLADLILIGFGVKVLFGAVQMGRQRQPASQDQPSSEPS